MEELVQGLEGLSRLVEQQKQGCPVGRQRAWHF